MDYHCHRRWGHHLCRWEISSEVFFSTGLSLLATRGVLPAAHSKAWACILQWRHLPQSVRYVCLYVSIRQVTGRSLLCWTLHWTATETWWPCDFINVFTHLHAMCSVFRCMRVYFNVHYVCCRSRLDADHDSTGYRHEHREHALERQGEKNTPRQCSP